MLELNNPLSYALDQEVVSADNAVAGRRLKAWLGEFSLTRRWASPNGYNPQCVSRRIESMYPDAPLDELMS